MPRAPLLRSTQPPTVLARSCRPRMPNERALARSSLAEAAAVVADLERQRAGGDREVDRPRASPAHAWRCWSAPPARCGRPPAARRPAGRSDSRSLLNWQAMPVRRSKRLAHPLQRRHQALLEDRRAQVVHDALAGARSRAPPSRAPRPRAGALPAIREWRAIQARSNFSAVSEPPTSSWISRAIAARSLSMLVCRCCASSRRRCLLSPSSRSASRRRAPRLVGLHRVQQRGHQARHVVLQQVVAGAVAHRLDRCVLADLARQQQEGHARAARLQQVQRHQAREARQVVVGDDRVPLLLERAQELRFGIDAQHLARRCRRARAGPASARGRARSPPGAGRAGGVRGPARSWCEVCRVGPRRQWLGAGGPAARLKRASYSAARRSVSTTGRRSTSRRPHQPAASASSAPAAPPASGTQGDGFQLNSKT